MNKEAKLKEEEGKEDDDEGGEGGEQKQQQWGREWGIHFVKELKNIDHY